MIFIKRNPELIPEKVIEVARRAQERLERLPPDERADFIKKKSHIWRGFSKYLSMMSYGKCWYSEARDAGANFDVDHFRPKAEAKRSEEVVDEEGYPWLAFDWENYRLSAQNCNRLNKDDNANKTVGKGSWFPLLDGSRKACWDDRCVEEESPVLIDPVVRDDLRFVDFDQRGLFKPSDLCVGLPAKRIRESAEIYGLNFERMREARFRSMDDARRLYETVLQSAEDLNVIGDAAPMNAIERQIEDLRAKTRADAPFSRAVRIHLQKLGADEYLIDRSMDAA